MLQDQKLQELLLQADLFVLLESTQPPGHVVRDGETLPNVVTPEVPVLALPCDRDVTALTASLLLDKTLLHSSPFHMQNKAIIPYIK